MQRHSGNAIQCAILIGIACLGAQDLSAQSQERTVELIFRCDRRSDSLEFTIALLNSGSTDTSLVIGGILANGRKYLASELAVEVRGTNGHTRYAYSDPSVPGIAGRLDPWVVGLPGRSAFTLTRPWNHFWADGKSLSPAPEPFDVRARLDAREIPDEVAIPDSQAFVGELVSEWISVPNECR
jgi:hypothetical protein